MVRGLFKSLAFLREETIKAIKIRTYMRINGKREEKIETTRKSNRMGQIYGKLLYYIAYR
jgi:hypothetical protein